MPCSRQLCHRHTTLSLAQNRKDLRLAIPRQLHKNLLVQNAEKILLINPLKCREDYWLDFHTDGRRL
jgi:hypothetical protein